MEGDMSFLGQLYAMSGSLHRVLRLPQSRGYLFTVLSQSMYDTEVHLNICDVMVDSHTAPSMFSVRVKQSKTDPFWVGVEVYLGATQSNVCPVKSTSRLYSGQIPRPWSFVCVSVRKTAVSSRLGT